MYAIADVISVTCLTLCSVCAIIELFRPTTEGVHYAQRWTGSRTLDWTLDAGNDAGGNAGYQTGISSLHRTQDAAQGTLRWTLDAPTCWTLDRATLVATTKNTGASYRGHWPLQGTQERCGGRCRRCWQLQRALDAQMLHIHTLCHA